MSNDPTTRLQHILEQSENPTEGALQYIRWAAADFLNRDYDPDDPDYHRTFDLYYGLLFPQFEDDEKVLLAVHDAFFDDDFDDDAFDAVGPVLRNASTRLRDDDQFVMKMVEQNVRNFEFASKRLRFDKEFVYQLVSQVCYDVLEHVSDDLCDDREFMMRIVQINGSCLKWAGENVQDDEQVVSIAIQDDALNLEYASPRLRDDFKTVMMAVKKNGECLEYAGVNSQDDQRIVSIAIQDDGWNLQYASPRLRDDFKTVMMAVKKDAGSLQFASPAMKNNFNIALAAVQKYGNAIRHVSPEMKNNFNIALAAVQNHGNAIRYVSPEMKNNFNIALAAVRNDGCAIGYVSPEMKNNFNIALAAVRNDGNVILYVSGPLRNDIEIVVSSQLQLLELPPTDVLLNREMTPPSIFNDIFKRARNCNIVLYYILKNRDDLIPSSSNHEAIIAAPSAADNATDPVPSPKSSSNREAASADNDQVPSPSNSMDRKRKRR